MELKNGNIEVKETNDQNTIYEVLVEFQSYLRSEKLKSDSKRKEYSQKLAINSHFIVAYRENSIVGFLCFYMNDEEKKCAYFPLLAVKNDLGVFSTIVIFQMFSKTLEILKKSNFNSIRLEVDRDNLKAQRLYKSLGLIEISSNFDSSFYMEGSIDNATQILNSIAKRLDK